MMLVTENEEPLFPPAIVPRKGAFKHGRLVSHVDPVAQDKHRDRHFFFYSRGLRKFFKVLGDAIDQGKRIGRVVFINEGLTADSSMYLLQHGYQPAHVLPVHSINLVPGVPHIIGNHGNTWILL